MPIEGEQVPDDHSIVRYCMPSSLADGAPAIGSFARKVAHTYLSVNDADMTDGATPQEKAASSKALMTPWLTMSQNGLLAALRVGTIRAIEAPNALTITYHPSDATEVRPANPYHSGIHNVPTEEDMKAGQTSVLMALVDAVTDYWPISTL